jgi:iron complex outermembrane receptor protein
MKRLLFNGEFATKLLVLIDGRTVYSPSSGGVFWNSEDVLM